MRRLLFALCSEQTARTDGRATLPRHRRTSSLILPSPSLFLLSGLSALRLNCPTNTFSSVHSVTRERVSRRPHSLVLEGLKLGYDFSKGPFCVLEVPTVLHYSLLTLSMSATLRHITSALSFPPPRFGLSLGCARGGDFPLPPCSPPPYLRSCSTTFLLLAHHFRPLSLV